VGHDGREESREFVTTDLHQAMVLRAY
jgi:hypothetical protein